MHNFIVCQCGCVGIFDLAWFFPFHYLSVQSIHAHLIPAYECMPAQSDGRYNKENRNEPQDKHPPNAEQIAPTEELTDQPNKPCFLQ